MTGWIHQVVRTAIISFSLVLIVLSPLCSFGNSTALNQLRLPMLNEITVARGLKNQCGRCPARRCTGNPEGASLRPSFYEQSPDAFETACAVFQALSYARCNLSDGINVKALNALPPKLSSLNDPMPSNFVEGFNLTNLFIRTYTFATAPAFSTNGLRCTLVSFFRTKEFLPDEHVFSLYVNERSGKTGLSIQECSGFMQFLTNSSIRYPFLNQSECGRQAEFCSRINRRRFLPTPNPLGI